MGIIDHKAFVSEIPTLISRNPSRYNPKHFTVRGVYVRNDLIQRCKESGISMAKIFSTLGNKALEEYLDEELKKK